ncbi:TetR/AcrR family transcriptional regulator [Arthrobacter sp. I2-34]|uniref:TetR/AcrR family transcriptional regulator n=1 Tax=Arthrobacter hankyongi TaxID=2904801 RepID=A0ABS9L2J2_9MICC|nr:TetR/AcrR family transcriptional regulator [Arthrobacter hankyongi]MCG2620848.1 TetR/AcrR family transcriptional regulator [Arthrobacter hankyongi]
MTEAPTTPPETGRRARKKQQTMERIAETARGLFLEHGFDGVTVAQIAAAADVSEQTVFNHFRTKEDLVYRGLEVFEAQLLAAIRERGAGESALAAFGRFLRGGRGLLHEGGAGAREQLAGIARLIAASPALQRREEQVFVTHTAALAGLLAEETSAGADDAVPWVAANAMMGVHRMLVAATRRGILQGTDLQRLAQEVDGQAERAISLLENGLGGYAAEAARGR